MYKAVGAWSGDSKQLGVRESGIEREAACQGGCLLCEAEEEEDTDCSRTTSNHHCVENSSYISAQCHFCSACQQQIQRQHVCVLKTVRN